MRLSAVPMIFFKPMVLDRTMKLEEWFPIAASLGIEGTEIHDRSLASFEPAYLDFIGEELKKNKLAVSQVIGAADFTHPEAAVRGEELKITRRNIDLAARLGANSVRLTAGQVHPGVSREQGVAWASEGLKASVDYALGRKRLGRLRGPLQRLFLGTSRFFPARRDFPRDCGPPARYCPEGEL